MIDKASRIRKMKLKTDNDCTKMDRTVNCQPQLYTTLFPTKLIRRNNQVQKSILLNR